MIVDTSALVAIVWRENGHERLFAAITTEPGLLPTPALVEFQRVVTGTRADAGIDAEAFIVDLLAGPLDLLSFTGDHARAAATANARFGTGNGTGGSLNLLDLMVHGCAKVMDRPILCTGRDFAATDAAIHPASRVA